MKNSKEAAARNERAIEQEEGITPTRRGSTAAESDKPEEGLPHPQDVNEMGQPS